MSEHAKRHFYRRLHFDKVIGPREWLRKAEAAGFIVSFYEDLRDHMRQSYVLMRDAAKELDLKSADGESLAKNYQGTIDVIDSGEISMFIAVLKLKDPSAVPAPVTDGVKAPQACGGETQYYNTADHYEKILGKDNLRLGYFPHLEDPLAAELDLQQAGDALTDLVIDWGGISNASSVLDMACGFGLGCVDIARATGAKCWGFDISSRNIHRAKELQVQHADLELDFFEGSFGNFTQVGNLAGKEFSHVISVQSLVHCHESLVEILKESKKVLAPGGRLLIVDLCSNDQVTQKAELHFHQRLHLGQVVGPITWCKMAEESGFRLVQMKDLGLHMEKSYLEMEKKASEVGLGSLAEDYRITTECVRNKELTMFMAIFQMEGSPV